MSTEPALLPALAFRNLRYSVREYGRVGWPEKALLQRVNGCFLSGTLNGILGPSGASKTTLLKCLSGRENGGLSADSQLLLGRSLPSSARSYFVAQDISKSIEGALTVGQILQYAFLFKNGLAKRESMKAHMATIARQLLLSEDVLRQTFEVCSGGQQRRVATAQELMALEKPSFLFVDEPTTGLDSYAALELVRCFCALARHNQLTIIASIHLPSSELLLHFDKLYVLARGVCIFSGPPSLLATHLQQNAAITVSPEERPIEVLIKMASADLTCPRLQALARHCLTTEYEEVSKHLDSLKPYRFSLCNFPKSFSLSDLYVQICRYCRITFIAQHTQLFSQLLFLFLAIVILSTFYNHPQMVFPRGCHPTNSSSTCHGNVFQDFVIMENINFQMLNRETIKLSVLIICSLFYSQLVVVFRNEHQNGWYSLAVFTTAVEFVTTIKVTIFILLISTTSYFIVSEHAIDDYRINWTRFGHFLASYTLCLVDGQSIGQLIGVLSLGSKEVTVILISFINTLHVLLDDFFFKSDEITVPAFVVISDLLGAKHITRYMVYVFYGIDRCASDEISWVLEKYSVNEKLWFNLIQIIFKILLIKLAILAVFFVKFGNFKTLKIFYKTTDNFSTAHPINIDFDSSSVIDIKKHPDIKRKLYDNDVVKKNTIIAWKNLTLFRPQPLFKMFPTNESAILNNLNGSFAFGTLNAIMGPSGAGKTTFLRILNGQHHNQLSENSQLFISNLSPISTVFITQNVSDHLMKGLTAKQMLIYASKLKNVNHQNVNHESIALKLLDELNLADSKNTKVECLSGGECRRLATALELTSLKMPNLILTDEPCSGLDSNSAVITISTLRKLTQNHPITICCTIHQPNTELLQLFDNLYCLSSAGTCVFSGFPIEIEHHLKLVAGLEHNESVSHSIETLIKYSNLNIENNIIVKEMEKITLVKQKSQIASKNIAQITSSILSNRVRFSFRSVWILSTRYCAYLSGHLWKEWLIFLVMYLIYGLNLSLFFNPAIAQPSGCINIEKDFNNTCHWSPELQQNEKLMYENFIYNFFFTNLFIIFVMLQTPMNLYAELPLFLNEHRNGYYSTGAFKLMKFFFETLLMLPVLAVYVYICNIYTNILDIYWPIYCVLLLSIITAQGVAYICVLICPKDDLINPLILGLTFYNVLFEMSNIFTSLSTAHYVYQTLSNLAIPRWGMQTLMLIEYGFGRCTDREIQPILLWMNITDEDYYYGLLMMVVNLFFYKGVALWMLIAKVKVPKRRQLQIKQKL